MVGDKQESTFLKSVMLEYFSVDSDQRVRLPRKAGRGELVIELIKTSDSRFHEGTLVPGWYQLRGIFPRHAFFVGEGATQELMRNFAEALRYEFFRSREEREQELKRQLEADEAERLQKLQDMVQQLSSFRPHGAPLSTD